MYYLTIEFYIDKQIYLFRSNLNSKSQNKLNDYLRMLVSLYKIASIWNVKCSEITEHVIVWKLHNQLKISVHKMNKNIIFF